MKNLPKKGDKEDVRCAFDTMGCTGAKVTEDDWCEGCQFYVCSSCDETEPMGSHDVISHQQDEDLDDE